MFKNLNPGALGIQAPLKESIKLAGDAGFDGVDINIEEVLGIADRAGLDDICSWFSEYELKPGGWGLPVEWREDEEIFRAGLKRLPGLARMGEALNCFRVTTWVLPYSDERPYKEQFDHLTGRFRRIAEILQDHGSNLALEFLGPRTLRTGHRYEFIHTMDGMLELCEAVGTGNVGLLLDAWHWYTSHGTRDDLKRLNPNQIVYVHVNDAPRGIPIDEQIDRVRCLPGATHIIDLVGFLAILIEIGYDGPVTPEPFNQELREMPAPDAARITGTALDGVWRNLEPET